MAARRTNSLAEFPNIQPKRYLYQAAQEAIKSYIVTNGLKPGDALPTEVELTRIFKISRTSVREAVKSLESLGIVEVQSGAGLYVKDFSFEKLLDHFGHGLAMQHRDLSEIMEVRFTLEAGMIDLAVERATADQIRKLGSILRRMNIDAGRGKYSPEDDRMFHLTLWENVDNKLMRQILDIFWMVFYQARKRARIAEPTDLASTYQRHLVIVDALVARDRQAARESMEQHKIGIMERIRRM